MTYSPERSALRGLGASGVLAAHVAAVASLGVAVATPLHALGWSGVALFLALSSYLLLGSLDQGRSLREYFVRRIVRIWPLYFVAVVLTFAFEDRDLPHLVANATFVSAVLPQYAFSTGLAWAPNSVLWTVQVEELAYLGLPLVAALPRGRPRLGVALVLALGSVAAVVTAPRIGMLPGTLYLTPWPWLGCYAAGIAAYELRARFLATARPAFLALALFPFLAPDAVPWPLGLAFVLPLVASVTASPPAFLRRVSLVLLGESSYALYLYQVLWLGAFGVLGVVGAYASSLVVEGSLRYPTIVRRMRATNLPASCPINTPSQDRGTDGPSASVRSAGSESPGSL
jgi:peptidoglycan/LPS O-acetylase OafA/YrhL